MADAENALILETTQGPVTIEMRPDLAPGHVARIKELRRDGRRVAGPVPGVIEGFMAQLSCPHGTGTGGSVRMEPGWPDRRLRGPHRESMARAASPDSGD